MNGYVIEKKDQYNLRWNNFESTLSGGLLKLMEEKSFVDVTLGCENQFIQAHKNILSVCSPYFKSLFNANPCKHPIVILRDVRLSELKALLQFMYRGEVNVSEDELPSLLKTADALSIKGLALISKDILNKPAEKSSSATVTSEQHTSEPPRKKTRSQSPSVSVQPPAQIDINNSEIMDFSEIKIEPDTLGMLEIDPISDTNCSPPAILHHSSGIPQAGTSNGVNHPSHTNQNINMYNAEENIANLLRTQKCVIEEMNKKQGELSQLLQQIQQIQQSNSQNVPSVTVAPGNPASYGFMPVNIVHPESTVRLLGSGIEIPGLTYNNFNRTKFSLFVNDLSMYLFGSETLKRSTLTGKPSRMTRSDRPKQQLDPSKVTAIINQTKHEFPGLTESQIRQAIRAKCNNLNLKQVTTNGAGIEGLLPIPYAGPYSTDDEATCD